MVDATDLGKTKIIASLIRDFIIYVEQNCFDERKAFEAFCDVALPHLKKYNKQLLVNRDYINNMRRVLSRESMLNMNLNRLKQINARFAVSEIPSMSALISAFLERGDVLFITQDHGAAKDAMEPRAIQANNVYTKFITQEVNLQSFSDLKTKYGNLGNTAQDASKIPNIIFDLSSLCYENSHWFIDELCSQSLTNFKVLVLQSQLKDFEKECSRCRYAESIYNKLARDSAINSRTDLENRDDEATIRKLRTENDVGVLTFLGEKASQVFNINNKDLSGHNVLPFMLKDGDVNSTYDTPWQKDILVLKDKIIAKLNESVDTYKKYEEIAKEKKNEEIATEQKNNNVSNDLVDKKDVVPAAKGNALDIKDNSDFVAIEADANENIAIAVDIADDSDVINPGIAAPHIKVNETVVKTPVSLNNSNVVNADLNNDQFTNDNVIIDKETAQILAECKKEDRPIDEPVAKAEKLVKPAKTVSLFGGEVKEDPISSKLEEPKQEPSSDKKEKKSLFKSIKNKFSKKNSEAETKIAEAAEVVEVQLQANPEPIAVEPNVDNIKLTDNIDNAKVIDNIEESAEEITPKVHEPQHVELKGTVAGSFDLTPKQKEQFEKKRAEELAEKARLEEETKAKALAEEEARKKAEIAAKEEALKQEILQKARDEEEAKEILAAKEREEKARKEREEEKKKHVPKTIALHGGTVASSFTLTTEQREALEKKRAEEAAERARLEAEQKAKELAEKEAAEKAALAETKSQEATSETVVEKANTKITSTPLKVSHDTSNEPKVNTNIELKAVISSDEIIPSVIDDVNENVSSDDLFKDSDVAKTANVNIDIDVKPPKDDDAKVAAKASKLIKADRLAVVTEVPQISDKKTEEIKDKPNTEVLQPKLVSTSSIATPKETKGLDKTSAENTTLEKSIELKADENAEKSTDEVKQDTVSKPQADDTLSKVEPNEQNLDEKPKKEPKAVVLKGSSVSSGFTLTPEQRKALEKKRAEEAAEKARLEAEPELVKNKVKRDPMNVKLASQSSSFGFNDEKKKQYEQRHEMNKLGRDIASKAEEERRTQELKDLNREINTVKAIEEYDLQEKLGDFVFDEKSDIVNSDATSIEDFEMTPERRELLRKYETSQRAEVEVKRNLATANVNRTDDQKRTTARNTAAVEVRKTSKIVGFNPSSLSDEKRNISQNKTNPERSAEDLKSVDDYIAATSIKHDGIITKPAIPVQNTRVRSSVTVDVVEKSQRNNGEENFINDLANSLNIKPFEYTGVPYTASVDLGLINIPSFGDSVFVGEKEVVLNNPLVMSQSLAIFAYDDDTNIKIFGHEILNAAVIAKLSTMIDNPIKLKGIEWPTEFVKNSAGDTVGCVLPKNSAKSLKKLLLGSAEYFALSSRLDLLKIAIDYIEKIIKLHSLNVFLGDEDLNSIVVNEDNTVTFINVDKMQIGDYLFAGNLDEKTAPELNSEEESCASLSSDNFVIALTLFKLLFLGRSPYVMNVKQGVSVDKLLAFRFPTNIFDSMTAPKDTALYIWSFFPQYIKQAFIDTLNYGYHEVSYRTSAENWLKLLKKWKQDLEGNTFAPMSLEITPSRMSIGDRNSMVTCRVCRAPVSKDDAVATDGLCHHCFNQRGKLTRCDCCGKEFLVSYRNLKLSDERDQKICPNCKSKFLRIKTISKCKSCGKSYNVTEGHVVMYKDDVYTFCPECLASGKSKES